MFDSKILEKIMRYGNDVIVITDEHKRITRVNPAFTRVTGYLEEEVIGKTPAILSSGRHEKDFYVKMWESINLYGVWSGEIYNKKKTGEVYLENITISAMFSRKKVIGYVAVASDIKLLKSEHSTLKEMAYFDSLTGLPNRLLLRDRLGQAISQAKRVGNSIAIGYVDLDGFKQVNDTLGHDAGDMVLVEVSKQVLRVIRGEDTFARLGGDEFAFILTNISSDTEPFSTINRILLAIQTEIFINGNKVQMGASIGITKYPEDFSDLDTLLKHADEAMYVAKHSGKNQYRVYS